MQNHERTFIMVKPDGVQRRLVGKIIQRFEDRGFKLVALKFASPDAAFLSRHYEDLKERPFFPGLIKYMTSGPVVAMVWEGKDGKFKYRFLAVKTGRVMLGETNPLASKPGSIRGDFALDVGRNVIHGSDAVESANKEIALWFTPEELVQWKSNDHEWIYE